MKVASVFYKPTGSTYNIVLKFDNDSEKSYHNVSRADMRLVTSRSVLTLDKYMEILNKYDEVQNNESEVK